MPRPFDYTYIAATIFFTVYGQLILKWRIATFGEMPEGFGARLTFLLSLLLDPAILSGFVAAFIASLAWMAAMTRFDLSHAYPFMALNFVIVVLLGGCLLSEPITAKKIIGVMFIVVGTVVAAQG
jgi:drug/metabolite transporter (DMT)-like permease